MVAIYYIAIVVSDVVVIVVVRAGATTSPFLLSQLVIVSHSYTRSEKIETKRDAFGNTTTNHGAEDVDGGQ